MAEETYVPKLFLWPQIQQQQQQQVQQEQENPIFPAVSTYDVLDKDKELSTSVDLESYAAGSATARNQDDMIINMQIENPSISAALIEEVRKYPCVWNIAHNSYKDRPKKLEAWRRIAVVLKKPESALVKEFDRLRDNYRRCIRKREKSTRSGSSATKLPTCEYFVELSFLRDIVTGRKTESNLPLDDLSPPRSVSPPLSAESDIQPQSSINAPKGSLQNARKRRSDQIDELLAISLSNDLKNPNKCETSKPQEDEDTLFCSSLIKTFQKLKRKRNKQAKMKVLEVLLDFVEDID